MSFRPIAVYGPPGGQVRLESADGHFIAYDDANKGRYPFPFIPSSMTAMNCFAEKRGQAGQGMNGSAWYGEVITAPPDPKNDWFLMPMNVSSNPTWWQMPRIRPLVATPTPTPYDWSPPLVPPRPTLLYYRGNFSGIRVPGAPHVPGGRNATVPGRDTDLMMAMHLHGYPLEFQDEFIEANVTRRYTHLQRSVPHALGLPIFGPTGLISTTLDQYVATSGKAKARGLYQDHWLTAGNVSAPNRDQPAEYYKAALQPVLDALISNNVIDMACVGWQLDNFNSGQSLQSLIDWFSDVLGPHDIPLYVHFDPEITWWGGVYNDRFSFWRGQHDKLTGIHYQAVPVKLQWTPADTNRWSIQQMQARMVDTLNPFGDGRMGQTFGRNFILDAYELTAEPQFFGPDSGYEAMTEDEGDLVSHLAICTRAATPVGGYGNGGVD